MTQPAAPLPPVLLLGGGKMGGAMLAGWREQGLAPSVVVDPALPPLDGPGVQVVAGMADLPIGFQPAAIILAVKPQQAVSAVPDVSHLASGAVVLSIMAGTTTARIAGMLGAGAAVVRAMPNTPAAIRRGITVAFSGPGVAGPQRDLCDALLSSIGEVAWVGNENLMDAVTAVSGSGPAYVFLLAELMQRAAEEQGIPASLARQMARATVAGSGALLAASADDAAALRVAVTSPGGTTQAALEVLMADGAMPALVSRAVDAATRRSRELAG